MEFGLPPNILEVTDVSQLLSLVVARDALEDAGYGEERQFDREHTGCVLGLCGHVFQAVYATDDPPAVPGVGKSAAQRRGFGSGYPEDHRED